MNTYDYEVTYKKDNKQSFISIRAFNELDAVKRVSEILGDITLISVSRVGN